MRHSIHAWNKVSRRTICAIAFLLLPSCTKSAENSSASSRRPDSSSSLTTAVISLSLLGHQRRSAEETRWEKEQEKAEPRVPSENNIAYNKEGEAKQHSTIQRESMNNDFCWLSTSCEEFSLTPPHDVISIVPPPPLPLFLFQKEILLKSSESEDISFLIDRFSFKNYYIIEKNKKGAEEEFLVRVDPQWLSSDLLSECSLCRWAQNNSTVSLFTQRESYKVARDVSWKWLNALLSVSFVSGIVGALFTCLLIKLKIHHRLKMVQILKDCDWPKEESDVNKINAVTTTTTTNCVKICRNPEMMQDLFHSPVKKFSAISSDPKPGDIDSEETYINANSLYFSYADIPPSNGILSKEIKCNMCKKSESFHQRHRGLTDHDFHESRTRVFSPSENYSTPSSAYYSDLSVGKIHSSRKKKKRKRKIDLERNVNKIINNTSRAGCALPLQKPVPSCTSGPTCGHVLSMSCMRNAHTITRPLPSCNDSDTNISQGHGPCLHESSLYVKDKQIPTSTNVLSSISKSPVSLQSSFDCCQCTPVNVQPGYVHLSPSYVHYVPNLPMLKDKNLINNYIGASYLKSCEYIPETDNHLEISMLGNNPRNLTKPSTHCDINYSEHLFTSNKFQCRCVSCSETQMNSFSSNCSALHCGSRVAWQQQNHSDPLGSKCETRESSLYEVPSEYI